MSDVSFKKIPEMKCPGCKSVADMSTTNDDDAQPRPDDVAVCFNCGAFLQFDADLKACLLTPEREAQLPFEQLDAIYEARRGLFSMQEEIRASIRKNGFAETLRRVLPRLP